MKLRRFHALSALVIVLYVTFHIANHLVGLRGVESHIAFMSAARVVYRSPIIETLLLIAVVFQIFSGIVLLFRGWKARRGFMPWLQAVSGAFLAFFLLNHVGSVLYGRGALHLDTNFYFAAAGFSVPPFQYFFAPYYFLGVLALFTHLACALNWKMQDVSPGARVFAVALSSAIGIVVSLLIVLSLAGMFYPVEVPPAYKASYGWQP